ncbi:amino acid deaminase [Mycobacterium aquaticum]|uniref:Amino acid deaminase n=1 Tax=Mycobacterium aquaticum TaxID=1927124 RepID=A0A1X0B515_9MYCO|nr:amino acid deaminase [Mycobacterium aquaticum]ORA37178.1 amino acid deaminase [Mycobacterium aquaticum]
MIDRKALSALDDTVLGPQHKGFPPDAWGTTVRDFLLCESTLDHMSTPVLTVDRRALASNVAVEAGWAETAGVSLAPHGKTTMAPQIWARQLDAGAWGITVGTPWQVQLARAFGVARIMLANAVVNPMTLAWLAAELHADPSFEFYCWADDVQTVELMDRALESNGSQRRIRVIVELGAVGGRTGARSAVPALAVASAVRRSARLTLAGVGGYEGSLSHDRGPAGLAAVCGYLDRLAELHNRITADGVYETDPIVTAGGSAFQDIVVDRLAGVARQSNTSLVLRCGAYVIHDDGFYAGISPLASGRAERPLRSAMHVWASTVSRPEPGLALLDAGKRDLPFDEGLPVPQRIVGTDSGALSDAIVTTLDSQHTYVQLPADAVDAVGIGTTMRLGLSDPCGAFDKWRLIPVIDDADAPNPRIVDVIHTFF